MTVPYKQGRIDTASAVDRTNDVLETAMRLSSGVRDAEAARQAYRPTGNAVDFAVFQKRMEDMRRTVGAPGGSSATTPVQFDRVNRLEGLIAPKAGSTVSPTAELAKRCIRRDHLLSRVLSEVEFRQPNRVNDGGLTRLLGISERTLRSRTSREPCAPSSGYGGSVQHWP